MKNKLGFLVFLVFQTFLFGQTEDAWVYFKDKPNAATFLSSPLTMLTQKALDRRNLHGVPLDIKDVPLEITYVTSVANSTGVTVKARSKWFNALHVQGTKAHIDLLQNLSEVDSIQYASSSLNKSTNTTKRSLQNKFEKTYASNDLSYGMAANQIEMLKGNYLHNIGYKGEGMLIAILDSGFKGVESLNAFSNLHDGNTANGEILGGYSFVARSTDIYAESGNTHGLSVLSTIAGYLDTEFIGTAPNAQFYLFSTEDHFNETPLEESLWVEAAERADSLGVSIINTSLGYSEFDNSNYNYSYADMDGQTTYISRGAELAASRGMLLVNSAGNSGNDAWHYITAPADAPSVLTIGAVDGNENIASFSSYGPTADNRVKPNVLAQGQSVYVINGAGNVAISNGTSFSGPIIAGMSACLWQAFPAKTAQQLKTLIEQSSDIYNNPTAQRGYGIPDFESIYSSLSIESNKLSTIQIIPSLVTSSFQIKSWDFSEVFNLKIFDISGKQLMEIREVNGNTLIDVSNINSGVYFAVVKNNKREQAFKFVKK
ncbi:S8 family serine peptidase [Bacteroidota bacterium]